MLRIRFSMLIASILLLITPPISSSRLPLVYSSLHTLCLHTYVRTYVYVTVCPYLYMCVCVHSFLRGTWPVVTSIRVCNLFKTQCPLISLRYTPFRWKTVPIRRSVYTSLDKNRKKLGANAEICRKNLARCCFNESSDVTVIL